MGTGFVYEFKGRAFLISNWHNFSGRNAETGQPVCKKSGAVPNRVRVTMPEKEIGQWSTAEFQLCDASGRASWFEHPKHGRRVDVGALPLEDLHQYSFRAATGKESGADMLLQVGDDVYILGYPLGISATQHFALWKRGSVASEPDLDIDGLPKLLIDATTRPGMSGAPVIQHSTGGYTRSNGDLVIAPGRYSRFIGIYSGRLQEKLGEAPCVDEPTKSQEAFLGIVWKRPAIEQTIEGGRVAACDYS